MLLIPLVAVLLACAQVAQSVDPPTEAVETPAVAEVVGTPAALLKGTPQTMGEPQPVPVPTEGPGVESKLVITGEPPITVSGELARPVYAGDSLIEEKIIEYPVVVRATLASLSSETLIYPDGSFRPVLQFNLNVSEYLRGTGPTTIVAVWFSGYSYATREDADSSRTAILAGRDSQWDDREAVFFLIPMSDPNLPLLSVQPQLASQYAMGLGSKYRRDDRYSLHSKSDKRWLPAVSGASTGDSMEFLLDVPPTTNTITLGGLKKRIMEVTAEYSGGDGSDRYKECVLEKYRYMRNQRNWPAENEAPWGHWDLDYSIDSGQAAGTVLDQIDAYGAYPDTKLPYWIEGEDSGLFETADGASTVIDKNEDGEDNEGDVIRYDKTVRLARPLPAGVYGFDLKETHPRFMVCDFTVNEELTVTVTSPTGVLHELLFDPVTAGSAVTADGTNGVLKPATITDGDGASATVESISYEAGKVKVKIVPWPVLSGKVLDFIELDGAISLSLNVSNSSVETASNTLTWSVSSQPWEDGDKLMVRIRYIAPFAPAPHGLRTSDVGGDSISLSWDSVGGVTGYVVERRASVEVGWETVDAKVTEKSHIVSGLSCGTTYEFRVGAYGDGTRFESVTGPGGYATASGTTDECSPQQPPAFDAASYSFEVSEDAAAGTQVGTVSATDPDEGDTLTYSITAGNEGGKFAIDGSTGVITVAGTLDHETVSSYTLMVQANDGTGGTATASVQINVLASGAPVFGASAYSFSIIEDASVGTTVGAVSAEDPNEGDTVTYSIRAGNDAGKFAIDVNTGRITVAGTLEYDTASSYTLTAQASDGNSDAATATVTVSIEKASCSNGTAVPSPDDNPGLVADCLVLLTNRDALEGTAVLNWSADTPIGQWKGVTVGGTPKRAQSLALSDSGLDGVVPGALSGLAALTRLDLSDNRLSGGVPASLGGMTKLEGLDLEYNQLTGTVPTALGALTELRRLSLSANQLTGTIPAELGKLTRLTALDLAENRLSEPIPAELKNLTALRYLSLGSNRLTGAVPPWLTSLSTLQYLYLDRNALTGAISAGLGGLPDLRVLSLGRNQLTGTIPPALGSLSKLEELALSRNNLTGSIPDALADLDLDYLYLSGNTFTGCVPAGLRTVANNDLDRLGLADCPNRPPAFAAASYAFSIAEDAAVRAAAGTVSAKDPDGDAVTYSITGGNDAGKFAIDASTGRIKVAGELDYETVSAYTLTVTAADGKGGTTTVTVNVAVTDVVETPPAKS